MDCGNGICVMNIMLLFVVYCRCFDGYEGDRCNKKWDYCDNLFCLYGRCKSIEMGYVCFCDKGFVGEGCIDKIRI